MQNVFFSETLPVITAVKLSTVYTEVVCYLTYLPGLGVNLSHIQTHCCRDTTMRRVTTFRSTVIYHTEKKLRIKPLGLRVHTRRTRPDQTRPGRTRPDQTRPDQTRPDQTRPDQARPDQTTPDQAGPDQTRPDRTGPDRTGPDQTRPGRTRPDQASPDQTRPDQTRPDQTTTVLPFITLTKVLTAVCVKSRPDIIVTLSAPFSAKRVTTFRSTVIYHTEKKCV